MYVLYASKLPCHVFISTITSYYLSDLVYFSQYQSVLMKEFCSIYVVYIHHICNEHTHIATLANNMISISQIYVLEYILQNI